MVSIHLLIYIENTFRTNNKLLKRWNVMANKISVYTINKIPTIPNEGFDILDAKYLYEASFSPTIMTDIFVGARYIKQVPSILWNETTASLSDFTEGVRLLNNLLPSMVKIVSIDPMVLREAAMALSKKKGRYFITDFTDVSMSKSGNVKVVSTLNAKYAKEAAKSAVMFKKIASIKNEKKQAKKLNQHLIKIRRADFDDLGVGGFI